MPTPETPRVSVVIPTYNYGQFVTAAVASCLAQTVPAHEVIVVDDGSTDDTRERLAPFGAPVRYLYQENRGLSAARNAGIRAATGEWIAVLDADDLWHPQKLERLLLAVALHPEVKAVSCLGVGFRAAAPTMTERYDGPPACEPVDLDELLLGVRFSGGSNAMIHRECFAAVGGFDESLTAVEDLDMWLRIAARFPLGRVPEPLSFVRLHQVNMSSVPTRMEQNHRRVLAQAFATLPGLQRRGWLRRQALARLHKEMAWMHFERQRRVPAMVSLGRSFVACPVSCGRTTALLRLRMLVRFCRPYRQQEEH